MVNNYVKPITSALREMDNNRLSIEHYYSLAWIGLYAENESDIAHRNKYLGKNEAILKKTSVCK